MRCSRALAAALLCGVPIAGCTHHGGAVIEPGLSRASFGRVAVTLAEGTRVRLTLSAGRVDGTVVEIDRDRVVVSHGSARDAYPCMQIRRLERRGDPVWNGAVIGAAVIALPAWNGCQNKGRNLTCVALGVGSFAAVGALLDAAHAGWKTIYVASPGSCGAP